MVGNVRISSTDSNAIVLEAISTPDASAMSTNASPILALTADPARMVCPSLSATVPKATEVDVVSSTLTNVNPILASTADPAKMLSTTTLAAALKAIPAGIASSMWTIAPLLLAVTEDPASISFTTTSASASFLTPAAIVTLNSILALPTSAAMALNALHPATSWILLAPANWDTLAGSATRTLTNAPSLHLAAMAPPVRILTALTLASALKVTKVEIA